MSLSVEEIEREILILSDSDKIKLIEFIDAIKINFNKKTLENNTDNPRKLGLFKGKIKMSDDFNDPLPDSFWLEGKI